MPQRYDHYTQSQLEAFGAAIASQVVGGLLIELIGDVGAGKTTLTKAIAAAMGIQEIVHSPTFTISNRYETPAGLVLAHYDFYRLADPGVMADELNETLHDARCVTVIEWADIVEGILPADRLTIAIEPDTEDTRQITVSSGGLISAKVLASV